MKEVIFAGFGGQGVLTGGLVLAYIASKQGRNISWMPAYGPTMRGGKANCVVKYSDTPEETIGSPIMEEADILIAMNQPSLDYMANSKEDAVVFVNTSFMDEDYQYKEGVNYIKIDCTKIASDIDNIKGQNLVMLGAVIKHCNLFDEEFSIDTMCKFFEDKGKGKYNEANVKALRAGFEAI